MSEWPNEPTEQNFLIGSAIMNAIRGDTPEDLLLRAGALRGARIAGNMLRGHSATCPDPYFDRGYLCLSCARQSPEYLAHKGAQEPPGATERPSPDTNHDPRVLADDETRQFLLVETDRWESTIRATTDQERVFDKAARFVRAALAGTVVECP